ncbi:MAG TPA: ABC transporter permease [Vicinamibacterales bacterium]|nr:ABC transporter permease [Vicinamibacterales bacterium]
MAMRRDDRRSASVYRLLLGAFPQAFRRRFASEMTEVFLDRHRAARRRGRLAAGGHWIRTATDLATHAMQERRTRPASGGSMLHDDLRHAVRSLRRQPSLAALVVVTLAIGMGATTAVFSVANTLLLQDLPYPEPHRLVSLGERNATSGFGGRSNVSLPNLNDWRAGAPAMERVAAWSTSDVNVAGPAGAERVRGARTTPDLFAVLGLPLTKGRAFTEAERAPGTLLVVLTESAWRQFTNRRDDVLGQTLVIDGEAHTVIGVAPDIAGLDVKIWRPLFDAEPATIRRNHAFRAVARLRQDATIAQLQGQLSAVAQRLEAEYPATNRGWGVEAVPLHAALTEDLTSAVTLMAVAVGTLLLLAAANTANLLGARAAAMRRDFAVRVALGASRARLLRQVLTESALLALAGSALGLGAAYVGTSLFTAVISSDMVLWATPGVDGRVMAFSAVLALMVSLLSGAWPAMVAARQRPQDAIQERSTSSPRATRRTRAVFAVTQVALASVLLVGTALLLASLRAALIVDPGFDPSGTMTFRVTPPRVAYADAPALAAYFDAMLTRLRALPGVVAAGAVSGIPLASSKTARGVIRPGDPIPEQGRARLTLYHVASPGYLPALGARLRGRDFTSADSSSSEPVAIVNQALAEALWPSQDPIGRQILIFTDEKAPRLVVGVVANIRHAGLDEETSNQYFVPVSQAPQRSMSIVLRTGPGFDAGRVRESAMAIDPTLPLYEVRTLDQVVSQSLAERRAMTAIVTAFGLIALVLATVGVYGVVSNSVSERRREIGIRLALGAQRGRVVSLVIRQALLLTAMGLVIGLGASAAGSRIVAGVLFGVTPLDVSTRVLVALVLVCTTLAASLSPARRASRVDPASSLKS